MTGPCPVTIPSLETDRLWLRAWSSGDIEEYARIKRDPEVMRHMGCGVRYRIKRTAAAVLARVSNLESRLRIRHLVRHWQRCGFGEWAVEDKATGKLIGQMGLTHHPDWAADPAKVEIGWLLARHAWGCGLATEGAAACLEFAFDQLRLDRIVSITNVENVRSEQVMQRIGMEFGGDAHWKGCDVVWYAMDREAWLSTPGLGTSQDKPSSRAP